jgi:ABC-type multidrug transport system fused ATPase/permease subunit
VTHRRTALRQADYILVLAHGRVEDEETLDELLARSSEMRQLWQGDTGKEA